MENPVQISKSLTKVVAVVADSTASLQLAIWNQQVDQIQIGKSYFLTEVSVRHFDSDVTHTTTPQTSITETDDIADSVKPLVMKPSLHEIDAAEVKTSSNCPFCNCTVSYNQEIVTFKCNGCNKKMLTSKIIKKTVTIVTVNAKDYKVPENVLKNFLPEPNMATHAIEDYLLLQGNAMIKGNALTDILPKISEERDDRQ